MLLTNSLFDEFILKEMEIQTFTNFKVSGQFYKDFFSQEEIEDRIEKAAVLWSEIRGIAFSIIRGNKTPLSMKLVFQLPKEEVYRLVDSMGGRIKLEDVGGLFINVRFEKNELYIITGTAIKTFTLDKTLEQLWDDWVRSFLKIQRITYNE